MGATTHMPSYAVPGYGVHLPGLNPPCTLNLAINNIVENFGVGNHCEAWWGIGTMIVGIVGLLEPLKKRCLFCSVVRTRVLPGCGATGRFAFECSRKEVCKHAEKSIEIETGQDNFKLK